MPKNSSSTASTSLLDLLNHKVLARIEADGLSRLMVARAGQSELSPPDGVQVSRKERRGQRIGVKGKRMYGNASLVTARWPDDHQEATRAPTLSWIVDGQADIQIGDYVLHVPEGYGLFIPPGVPYPDGKRSHLEGARRKDGKCDILTFALRGAKIQCWMCYSRGPDHRGPNAGENIFILSERAAQYLHALSEELVARKADYQKIGGDLLSALLLTLRREIESGHFLHLSAEDRGKAHPADGFNAIEQAQHYMRSHLNEPLTIEGIAQAIYMSRAHFAKRFHEQTGQTVIEFLNVCRLEQAQTFLRETDWSVSLIAEFVGFKSASYFHRLFRSRLGMSPTDFRLRERTTSSKKPIKAA